MTNRETSLKAAKECIDAALRNLKKNDDFHAEIAIDNAIESLKSAKLIKEG